MHLDEEQFERLRDGELPPAGLDAARRHVGECASCASRLDRARAEDARLAALFAALDAAAPPSAQERTSALASVLAAAGAPARAHGPRRRVRVAVAAALLVVVAGAAVGFPGSPLRAWWSTVLDPRGAAGRDDAPAPETSPRATSPSPDPVGIAVDPGRRLVLRFTSVQAAGSAIIRIVSTDRLVVEAPAGAATFDTAEGMLTIRNEGASADFQIDVPITAPSVEIRVAGRRAWRRAAGRIDGTGPPDSLGESRVSLGR